MNMPVVKISALDSGGWFCQYGKSVFLMKKSKAGSVCASSKRISPPLFDEESELMGTVGVVHDVTDLGNMTVEPKIILRDRPVAIPVYDDRAGLPISGGTSRDISECCRSMWLV